MSRTRAERSAFAAKAKAHKLPQHVCRGKDVGEYTACPICYKAQRAWKNCHYSDYYKDTEYRNCKEQKLVQSGIWAEVYEAYGV